MLLPMMGGGDHGVTVWSSPAWQATAVAWLDARLGEAGIKRTGEVTHPHVRPWATVLRAPTTLGVVWMKAAGPGAAFEIALYELLARAATEHVLTPIAIDVDRAWMVLPDGGSAIGDRLAGDELAEAMVVVLPQYAQMQRDLAPHADAMVALGVTDMRPAVMPARFEEALAVVGEHVERRGVTSEQQRYAQVVRMGPTVAAWCDRLAVMPGPASLDHNDLHPFNVLTPEPGGPARFYDWGDAVLAHPFSSMLVALGFMQYHVLNTAIDDPRLLRMRDAYLEPFSDLGTHAELVETLELACRVGKVARSLIWHRALSAGAVEEIEEQWADAPTNTLDALLDESYLTGA